VDEDGFTHACKICTCHVEHPIIITCKGNNEFGGYNNLHLLGLTIPCLQHLRCVCQNCCLELVQTNIENIQHIVENLSFATPISMQPCGIKCHLRLQMVAYVTTFQIWMDFDLPFN